MKINRKVYRDIADTARDLGRMLEKFRSKADDNLPTVVEEDQILRLSEGFARYVYRSIKAKKQRPIEVELDQLQNIIHERINDIMACCSLLETYDSFNVDENGNLSIQEKKAGNVWSFNRSIIAKRDAKLAKDIGELKNNLNNIFNKLDKQADSG